MQQKAPDRALSQKDLKAIIKSYPQRSICYLPTPLERLDNLSKLMGNINLYIKRDDQTGLAAGGNKARKLDFIIADALEQKADSIITWAGVQSNWCRQTAAGARKAGLKPILVLFKRAHLPAEFDGNLLLDTILGADIRTVELEPGGSFMNLSSIEGIINRVVEEETAQGRTPYVAPIGGSFREGSMHRSLGSISYIAGLIEMLDQAESQNITIDYIVLATGSGSTQAGLAMGAKLICPDLKVVGISVCEDLKTMTSFVERVSKDTIEDLQLDMQVKVEDIIVFEEYIRDGYGILDSESSKAIRTVGETEGILLDPVYTGKAMAGLLDLAKQDYFKSGSNVVFLHTGGTPALYPYRDRIKAFLG